MNAYTALWRRWRTSVCSALLGVLTTAQAVAAGPKPEPRVFKTGHYRLADGVSRAGNLCLVSDNELLVKDESASEPQRFAAVQVKNFVIGTDSFAVLRKFDVVINGVATPYPCAMVRVYQAAGGLELYGLRGAMDVYTAPDGSGTSAMRGAALGLRNGLAGVAVGAATGALLEKKTGTFEEQVLTVLLLRTPGHPEFQTLQAKTKSAHDLLEALTADQAELSKKVHRLFPSAFTPEKIAEIIVQYAAAKKG